MQLESKALGLDHANIFLCDSGRSCSVILTDTNGKCLAQRN